MMTKIKNKKSKIKANKGITLIALVITIIVLLILAAVSITTLTGENGILTQATTAKEKRSIGEEKEAIALAYNGVKTANKGGAVTAGDLNTELGKNKVNATATEDGANIKVVFNETNRTYTLKSDGTISDPTNQTTPPTGDTIGPGEKATGGNKKYENGEKTAVIPEGFTVDKTLNTIDTGLVVKGPDESEFVWVPVEDINTMSQCETAGGSCKLELQADKHLKCITHNSTAIVGKLWATAYAGDFGTVNTAYNANSGLREPAIVTDYDNNTLFNNGLFTLDSLKADYKEMAESVAKNGGFYIGRYETSLEGATKTAVGTGNVQSKANVIPNSAGDTATYRWYGLYSKQNKTYTGTNNSVVSSMIWGSQYDAMLNWVKNGSSADKDKITTQGIGNNSGGILSVTGNEAYNNDSINNIRDLGGNLFEWTLEALDANVRVSRGR